MLRESPPHTNPTGGLFYFSASSSGNDREEVSVTICVFFFVFCVCLGEGGEIWMEFKLSEFFSFFLIDFTCKVSDIRES